MNSDNWWSEITEQLAQEGRQLQKGDMPNISFQTYRHFMKNGDRSVFEKNYFLRRKRLTTFGLLLYLSPEKKAYMEALENEIWQVCNEFTWCLPAHLNQHAEEQSYQSYKETEQLQFTIDLFAAETAFTLAEMVDFFGDKLDSFLIERIKIEVDRRVFKPFKNKSFHWEQATHNWASVCAGSVGAAALYLLEDKEQQAIIDRVLTTMDYYLSGFEEDGACTEGYGYWQYGFGYFIYFADLLYRFKKIDLFANPKVKTVAMFQQHIFLANNSVVNFADAEPKAHPMLGFTHFLHQLFPEIHVPSVELTTTNIIDHCGRWAPAIRELWWYDVSKEGSAWPETTHLFEQSAIYLSRLNVKNEAYAFAVKAGHNDEPHNHNDIGQFILYAHGKTFLKDLGSGQYHKDYFNENRYDFICNSAEGHSVPIINGTYQQEGKDFYGTFRKIKQTESLDQIEVDASNAYPDPTLIDFKRVFTWQKKDQPSLQLEDFFQFSKAPQSIVESFIADDVAYKQEEDRIILQDENKTLQLIFENSFVKTHIERKSFINHQGVKEFFLHILFYVRDMSLKQSLKFEFK